MLMHKPTQAGFTLMEMMIVVVIIAIVASIAMPNFRSMTVNAQIRSVAESVRNGLQLARAEAVKRNETVKFTLNADKSWQVSCLNVTATCPAGIASKGVKEGGGGGVTLTVTGAKPAEFTSLGTLSATASQLSKVAIASTTAISGTRPLTITLGVGGNARMCDPNITAATDTRKC